MTSAGPVRADYAFRRLSLADALVPAAPSPDKPYGRYNEYGEHSDRRAEKKEPADQISQELLRCRHMPNLRPRRALCQGVSL